MLDAFQMLNNQLGGARVAVVIDIEPVQEPRGHVSTTRERGVTKQDRVENRSAVRMLNAKLQVLLADHPLIPNGKNIVKQWFGKGLPPRTGVRQDFSEIQLDLLGLKAAVSPDNSGRTLWITDARQLNCHSTLKDVQVCLGQGQPCRHGMAAVANIQFRDAGDGIGDDVTNVDALH